MDREVPLADELIFTSTLTKTERNQVYGAHRAGRLVKLARRVYFPSATWGTIGPERLGLRAAAYQLALPESVVVGSSAAALHGVAVSYGLARNGVAAEEILHLGVPRSSRAKPGAGVVFHRMDIDQVPQDTLELHGVDTQVSRLVPAVTDMLRFHDIAGGLVSLEDAWHRGRIRQRDVTEYLETLHHKKGHRRARRALQLAGPWSESPRETELKVRLREYGFPPPLQQVTFYDLHGDFVARVDFFFPEAGLVVEYEGAAKTEGPDAGKTALRELPRSRALHNLGLVIRHIDAADFREERTFRQLKVLYEDLARRRVEVPHELWQAPPSKKQWDQGVRYGMGFGSQTPWGPAIPSEHEGYGDPSWAFCSSR